MRRGPAWGKSGKWVSQAKGVMTVVGVGVGDEGEVAQARLRNR